MRAEYPELFRLALELTKTARLPVARLCLSPAQQPSSFSVGRTARRAATC